jgi:hypothetical protein
MIYFNVNDKPQLCKNCNCSYCRQFCKNYDYNNKPNEDCLKHKDNLKYSKQLVLNFIYSMVLVCGFWCMVFFKPTHGVTIPIVIFHSFLIFILSFGFFYLLADDYIK